ncbi:MAG: long-chain fatty acid--CoA ligase [Pseudomonadota bacterium]|nr:long-chain fatty acid--CoA ligase [Pseudomonadota bacterium]
MGTQERAWLKSYPQGMRWDSEIETGLVQGILDQAVARWPDNPAVQFMGRRISFRELDALVNRAAKGLQQQGVGPGVHVGLFLPNSPHHTIAFFAILRAGGTVVNYSPLDVPKVLEHKIEDSQTDIVITLDLAALYPQMAAMLGKTRLKKLIVGNMGEMSAAPEAVNARLAEAKQLADVSWDERHVHFADLLDNDGDYVRHDVGEPAQALAVLQYTGGTTGLPKGAMLTHANLTAAVSQSAITNVDTLAPGKESFLAVLPLFHIYALTANMLYCFHIGAELVQHARFDPGEALRAIRDKQVSVFAGVPTMFTALIDHPDTPGSDLSALKYCLSGGAPLPVEVGQRYTRITGCAVAEGWGMTETSPTGTFTPSIGGKIHNKPGSCGIPMPGVDIKLLALDGSGQYVPLGEKGEICIKGPNVMLGYWKRPDASRDSLTADGYFRTGDVAYMDEDGYLYIVDRCKDMLLCSGYNVYPRMLEEAIYQHPDVNEVCVIGVPDPYRGQSPKAFVTLKAGAQPFTLAQLQDFLKDKLGKHEMVQALDIRKELPKTPVGKLSKKDLADEEARKRAAAPPA